MGKRKRSDKELLNSNVTKKPSVAKECNTETELVHVECNNVESVHHDNDEPMNTEEGAKLQNNENKIDNVVQTTRKEPINVRIVRGNLSVESKATQALYQIIDNSNNLDFLKNYFEIGGNCLEILRILESKWQTPSSLIIDTAKVLIQYVHQHHKCQYHATYEACLYFLNNHMELINTSLKAAATDAEKIAILTILAAMVELSNHLAKEILHFVHLNTTVLNSAKNDVRITRAFQQFILSFFTEGYCPKLIYLVNKKYLFASCMGMLENEKPPIVKEVLETLYDHLINNPAVPKPTKVKLITRGVLQGFISLYRNPNTAKAIHKCMLVLCTSYSRGIVFRDDNLGMDNIYRNSAMLIVLSIIFREKQLNDFHCDLVARIAVTCTDVVRFFWSKIVQTMDDVNTERTQWNINCVQTYLKLIDSRGGESFSPAQYAHAIQALVMPTSVIRKVLHFKENAKGDENAQMIATMNCVLLAVKRFTEKVASTFSESFYATFRHLMTDYIRRTMPFGAKLVDEWRNTENSMLNIIDTLLLYHDLCPHLLFNINLKQIQTEFESNIQDTSSLNLKILKLLLKAESTIIVSGLESTSGSLNLEGVLKFLSEYMKENDNPEAIQDCEQLLTQLFEGTELFSQSELEIQIWIGALKTMGVTMIEILTFAKMHYTELIEEIAITYGQDIAEEINKNEEIIKELSANSYCPATTIKRPTTVKCSVFVLAALKQKLDSDVAVLLGNALMHVFHLQTDIQSFRQIVKKHKQNIPKDVYKYIMQGRDQSLSMDANINDAIKNSLMLANAVFKLVHLNQPITEDLFSKIRNDKNCLSLIYCNPNILNKYLENENIQKFIFSLTEHLKSDAQNDVKIASYLKMLQRKLRSWMMQTINQKHDTNIQDHIKLLNVIGLSTADLESILHQLVELPSSQYLNDEQKPNVMYNIATAILNNAYGMLCKENISTKPFEYIIHFVDIIIDLNLKKVDTSELAEAVYNYFARFPHQVASLKEELRTLFVSVACRYEYCKSNTKLAMHIYKYSNGYYLDEVNTHLKDICAKKGFILPLLDVLRHDENFTQSLAQTMFQEVLPLIAKTLQKPQKAGPHFEKHYEGICHLMQQCMPLGEMQKYLEKPVKFDANHVFIVAMCNAMYKSYFIGKNKKRLHFSVSSLFTHINFMVSHLKGLKAENENNDERIETLKKVVKYFVEFLQLVEVFWRKKAMPKANDVRSNDTFQTYYKLTLRHGVDSNKSFLMKPLSILSKYVCFTSKEAEEIVEMIFTHSEFLQIASEIPNDTKKDIFELLQTLCKAQSTVMKPYHVPILLAAYQATLHPSDRILLKLLKLYEENATSTAFYDYKPFFWGGVAANVYSIQTSSSHQVIRRGRPSDVLDSLQENLINATIMNFPQNLKLSHINISPIKRNPQEVYDLCFMLPLLSQILAPENQIVTYKFTRSGALALVIMGLSSHEREMRLASCHVLARFHYHLEAVRKSKDHVIWVQFVEAIARGMAALKDFRLHSFAAVFLARTALILANPQLPMFIPLSNYVAIKNKPNFSVIPELHTFLRSGDINHSMYKQFILEVLADGMRTEGDANILIDNYGFKLIMEMFNSAISTDAERILILNVIERATQLPNTTKRLCNGLALISWLYDILQSSMHYDILALLMKIYANLVQTSGDKRMVKIAYNYIIDNYFDVYFDQGTKLIILKAILLLQTEDKSFLTRERIKKIVNFSGCVKSEYILRFNVQMKVDSVKPEDSIELTTQNLMQICLN